MTNGENAALPDDRGNKPVLFLIFNRPDLTRRVFAEIRRARPPRLYLAGDGPRPDRPGEAERVRQSRGAVLGGVDWDCEVKTLFRETNLGCRRAVGGALDWFFENEEMGLILEDDCLPAPSFFRYCRELLDYYRHDTRIMTISGDNFQQGRIRGKYSYYFSQLPHIWGWAGWRRAWRLNRAALEKFEEIMAVPGYWEFTHDRRMNQWRRKVSVETYQGKIDTWDFLWTFANLANNALAVLPNVNLVQNIGFGGDATHTGNQNKRVSIPARDIAFPLNHPPYMICDREADEAVYRLYEPGPTFFEKIRRSLAAMRRRF